MHVITGGLLGPASRLPTRGLRVVPPPASLFEALHDAFVDDEGLVAAFGHDEANGPHKFWLDEVAGGDGGADGPGASVPPPYVVCSVLGATGAGLTFSGGYTRTVTVLLKTFAATAAEANRLGGIVNDALLAPSEGRPRHAWVGGNEVTTLPLDDRTTKIPGRGGPGGQLYGRYSRFGVIVSGQY
jgi:hypothetical protein